MAAAIQWFPLFPPWVINIPEMFRVLQEQNVKDIQLNIPNGLNQMTKSVTWFLFLVQIHEALAKLHFKAQINTEFANKSENTHFALLLMSFCSSGWAVERNARALARTQRTLCTSNDRTAQPHTTGWRNLHHRSPGSCSKCIQSSPTHTKVWCAKNAMWPCAGCLYPGQRERSLFSHRSGFLWIVLCKQPHCNPRCHKHCANSHYVKG